MRPTCVRLLAAIPILALIGGLPFVNHEEPLVFGLPFLLFWLLAWVMATPAFLAAAYVIEHRPGDSPGGRGDSSGRRYDARVVNAEGMRRSDGGQGADRGGR